MKSAGLVMYRSRGGMLEVFLAHPGGPFYKNRDDGVWDIPKGGIEEGEEPLDAAVREFREETGLTPQGPFTPLGSVKLKSGKVVFAWAFCGDIPDDFKVQSISYELEFPPRSGKIARFPEIDRAGFFPVDVALTKILPAKRGLIERLAELQRELP